MGERSRDDVRNLAIIAHVDHGKTTLVDALLWQSGLYPRHDHLPDKVLAALDLEREKRISVLAPLLSLVYRSVRVNLVDVPGHAPSAGAAERALGLVEGVLVVVDAVEGPATQTRYVLRKALEAGLAPLLVVNKIDRDGARPREVRAEVRALFADLDATARQLDCPVLYANARAGTCRRSPAAPDESLLPLFDEILRAVPAPSYDPDAPLQFHVAAVAFDDFLGRLALGRLYGGELRSGMSVSHCNPQGGVVRGTVGGLLGQDGDMRVAIECARPGDLVAVAGIEAVRVGDTISDPERPRPLPAPRLDEPVLALTLEVNDSPLAGLDGSHADGRALRERLWRELLTNVAVRIEETESPDGFLVAGRSELQLAILIEMMRREGYELLCGRPRVLTREADGTRQEPMELLIIDCPEPCAAVVTEKATSRRGRMTKMVNHGAGRVRMEFRLPSRGLVGYRAEFLLDTRGTGILHHVFDGFDAWAGAIPGRATGSLVADRPGRATAHAIEHLQPRGAIFVAPGDQVYRGMIVGENSRPNDLDVDVTKERRRAGDEPGGPPRPLLVPPRSFSLEQALEFIRDDERVEVTPRALRLRKKLLGDAPQAGRF